VLLFPDIKEADTCTDSKCYRTKVEAHIAQVRAAWGTEHPVPLTDLSTGWQTPPKGTLGRNDYETVTGKANDPNVRYGIITHGDQNFGKVVAYVIPNKSTAAKPLQERKQLFQAREQEIDNRQRSEEDLTAIPLVVQSIRQSKKPTLEELLFLAVDVIGRGYHDMLVKVCKGKKLVPVENSYHIKDYAGAIEKDAHAQIKDEKSFIFWLLEFYLYHHVGAARERGDPRLSSSSILSEGNPIHVLAKRRGVNLKTTLESIQKDFDQRKERAQKRLGLTANEVKKPEVEKAKAKKGKKR
jgi:hypothetical protein